MAIPMPPPRERVFFNGLGGFTPDGREYVISLAPGQTTPAPWTNVLANAHIGTVISESGGAYTWVDNAHEFRITPWHNDPVSDTSGEAFYIRDEETGQFWSPTPLPARGDGTYVCRHGFGYSVFEYEQMGIGSEFNINTQAGTPIEWATFFKMYFLIKGSDIRPYADGGFNLFFVTGGPYFGIRFGGGALFKIANRLYVPADLQLGLVFPTGATVFYLAITSGIRYEI